MEITGIKQFPELIISLIYFFDTPLALNHVHNDDPSFHLELMYIMK